MSNNANIPVSGAVAAYAVEAAVEGAVEAGGADADDVADAIAVEVGQGDDVPSGGSDAGGLLGRGALPSGSSAQANDLLPPPASAGGRSGGGARRGSSGSTSLPSGVRRRRGGRGEDGHDGHDAHTGITPPFTGWSITPEALQQVAMALQGAGGYGDSPSQAAARASASAAAAAAVHGWSESRTRQVEGICDKANGSAWLHERAEERFRQFYYWLQIPSIVLGFIAGAISMLMQIMWGVDGCNSSVWGVSTGVATMLAATMQGMCTLFGVTEKMDAHRKAKLEYLLLYNALDTQLGMEAADRSACDVIMRKAVEKSSALRMSVPTVHPSIIARYRKQHGHTPGLVMPDECRGIHHVQSRGAGADAADVAPPPLSPPQQVAVKAGASWWERVAAAVAHVSRDAAATARRGGGGAPLLPLHAPPHDAAPAHAALQPAEEERQAAADASTAPARKRLHVSARAAAARPGAAAARATAQTTAYAAQVDSASPRSAPPPLAPSTLLPPRTEDKQDKHAGGGYGGGYDDGDGYDDVELSAAANAALAAVSLEHARRAAAVASGGVAASTAAAVPPLLRVLHADHERPPSHTVGDLVGMDMMGGLGFAASLTPVATAPLLPRAQPLVPSLGTTPGGAVPPSGVNTPIAVAAAALAIAATRQQQQQQQQQDEPTD